MLVQDTDIGSNLAEVYGRNGAGPSGQKSTQYLKRRFDRINEIKTQLSDAGSHNISVGFWRHGGQRRESSFPVLHCTISSMTYWPQPIATMLPSYNIQRHDGHQCHLRNRTTGVSLPLDCQPHSLRVSVAVHLAGGMHHSANHVDHQSQISGAR
jgi:hypothetical protein